ncbi:MAG: hypothetical protein AAGL66_03305 [Pseudomonadota bacterium]
MITHRAQAKGIGAIPEILKQILCPFEITISSYTSHLKTLAEEIGSESEVLFLRTKADTDDLFHGLGSIDWLTRA